MSKNTVLILGARSDIAKSTAEYFAKAGYDIQLAARNSDNLDQDKSNLEIRYKIKVTLHEFDVLDTSSHKNFASSFTQLPNIIICAVGYLGEQKKMEQDIEFSSKMIRTNFEGPASIFAIFANLFEKRGSGTLVGISSVAGERGRAQNYIYGSSKAGFTTFLSGLRNRLSGKGVHVVTVLPGFVATKMTNHMKLPNIITAQPDKVGKAIFDAVKKGTNIIYVSKIWHIIIIILKIIPEQIFKKMKL
jgi:decaprenylphospho-beta-D-erythro-pentofuranosid-2-ulose 2-reductase